MALDGLFTDRTSAALARSLDATGIRHRVIADNIANVETPGFTRSEVVFEDQLKRALQDGDEREAIKRIGSMDPQIQADRATPSRADGNNVSIDKEMAGMVKNTLQYEALIPLMRLRSSMLRAAITEGRR